MYKSLWRRLNVTQPSQAQCKTAIRGSMTIVVACLMVCSLYKESHIFLNVFSCVLVTTCLTCVVIESMSLLSLVVWLLCEEGSMSRTSVHQGEYDQVSVSNLLKVFSVQSNMFLARHDQPLRFQVNCSTCSAWSHGE